jgi:hypothetical protein
VAGLWPPFESRFETTIDGCLFVGLALSLLQGTLPVWFRFGLSCPGVPSECSVVGVAEVGAIACCLVSVPGA